MPTDRQHPDAHDQPTEAAVQQDFSIPEDADYVPDAGDEARRQAEGNG